MSDQELIVTQSPLAEVSPASIDELFSMDPLDMKDADIDLIVAHIRRERSTWETKSAATAAKKAAKAEPAGKLSLGDLDL